ncbi:winged helix-turn-helix domain-containing protein [Chengkuizengella axinellae]|uniref:Winged helix-turn-helix domain-containing protein n=1 Tax=Chengkuizengella axinellae TaxID=3064388 RepID=A0ABT9IUE4_9BACL|nr:winged helix-turn-helix domain-containing protein [Chengkuizengella sp. 2205SS18-9]MDP5272960.1 winged helix-turn-helix domain-containing protein [Chengkuizengella sp. 2205SS18-9]
MSYVVSLENSTVYELLLSLLLYKRRKNLKYLYKGSDWVEKVNEKMSDSFKNKLDGWEDLSFGEVVCLFIEKCPHKQDVDSFLEWFENLPLAASYELLTPHLRKEDSHLLLDLENQKKLYSYLLTEWNRQYFKFEDVGRTMTNERNRYEKKMGKVSSEQLVEDFATGLKVEIPSINHVVLVPSIHFQPLHTFSVFKEKMFVWYPVQNEESRDKVYSISKALSDEKRLDILQLLSQDKHKFTDILKEVGGTKGNLHHHIMILRSANLIRVHLTNQNQFYLSTRRGFVSELNTKLKGLINII